MVESSRIEGARTGSSAAPEEITNSPFIIHEKLNLLTGYGD
jgi:hypothetical protein